MISFVYSMIKIEKNYVLFLVKHSFSVILFVYL